MSSLIKPLLLAATLALGLTACNKDTTSTPAAGATDTPAAASAPSAETPMDPQIAAQAQAAAKVIMEQVQTGPAPVEGNDYVVIKDGSPWQPLTNGETGEIAEVFAYWCPHCAEFQPLVDAWKPLLPKTVRFAALPMSGGDNDSMASVFFAAEMTNQLPKVHDRMFNAIHIDRVLKPNASRQDVLAFLASHGVDAKAMAGAMDSFAMKGRLNQAVQFARRSEVAGTPTLIVNGKYRVLGRTQEDMLRIATALVLKDNAAQ
ncbi:thiol:disulfide interchange protein DsbA/DsbL [Lysobacter sp. HDW10]|uniref:thiol:disulfide interchange protein DsbA/DsbL n=1 Tax=Lysobacter sp. HDW10 TaxID=2714936 RepID=UPI00140E4D78|nr:thiol:disulfide interchange protein DsbA/DsbL [Lysobacter sp. HDW10]QIK80611.1 thiol:disulfide interchange protein DsbA/DsbL [Lysobacter sp. HDW10]